MQIQRLESILQEHKVMAANSDSEIQSLSSKLAESQSHLEQVSEL